MLRLGDRHAVARNKDHPLRRLKHVVRLVGRQDLGFLLLGRASARGRLGRPEPAEQHVRKRSVHRQAHDPCQDQPARSDQRPGDDQQRALNREARGARREARVRVEQADDHRHVAPTDRHNERDAQHQRQPDRRIERDDRHRVDRQPHTTAEQRDHQQPVDHPLTGVKRRGGLDLAAQFPEGDQAARERHAADEDRQEHAHGRDNRDIGPRRALDARRLDRPFGDAEEVTRPLQLGPPDQQAGDAARPVEQRDHLGHRGHFDQFRRGHADRAAHEHARQQPDQRTALDERLAALAPDDRDQRAQHGREHAGSRDEVAPPGRRALAQQLEPEDKADARNEKQDCGEDGHGWVSSLRPSGCRSACRT